MLVKVSEKNSDEGVGMLVRKRMLIDVRERMAVHAG